MPACPVLGMLSPLSAGLLRISVRRIAMRHLPHEISAVQIDSGENTIGRLDERQTIHVRGRPAAPRAHPPWRCLCHDGVQPLLGRADLRRIGSGAEAGAFIDPELLASRSLQGNECPSIPRRRLDQPHGDTPAFAAGAKTMWVSGSYPAPGQFVPPPQVADVSERSDGPPTLLTTAGGEHGTHLVMFDQFQRLRHAAPA